MESRSTAAIARELSGFVWAIARQTQAEMREEPRKSDSKNEPTNHKSSKS
jgi:hypothetical protein